MKKIKEVIDAPTDVLLEIWTGSENDFKKKEVASLLNITPSSLSKQISKFKNN